MGNSTLVRMLTLILFLVLPLRYVNAQDSRQNYEGLKIPASGSSKINFRDQISDTPSGRQKQEIIGNPNLPLNTFTVTNNMDDGIGSFRDAITKANETSGADVINFTIPGTGIKTLTPLTPLPDIIYPVIIDGTTQSGYTDKPLIEIDGIWAGPADGISIQASGCTLKGIALNRFNGAGVALYFGQTTIEGCFLGLDPDGTTNKGNLQDGIFILSANNTIGNPNGKRNVISGNELSGIYIALSNATGNKIQNNYIGTDFSGTATVPNKLNGITFYQSSLCTVGGSSFDEMNVISGNLGNGIRIEGGQSQQINIKGNRIGTTANGSLALGNLFNGITVIYGTGSGTGNPSNIIIGGKWTESQNLISGNTQAGVAFFLDAKGGGTGNIVAGNLIGTDYNGTNKIPNTHGIFIIRDDTTGSMPGVKIGGSISDSNNVISGNNQMGIWIKSNGARNNLIYGNYIGTTRSVTVGQISALGNGFAGVYIDDAPFNSIGDINTFQGNVIGDNYQGGISIIGSYANGNSIYNNYIGTYLIVPQGVNLGNRTNGIYIEASNTKVGGPGLINEIANNYSKGIFVYAGTKNVLYENSIYKNGTIGIDLAPDYITKNDSGDIDFGPNNLQNFPILDSANLMSDKIIIHSTFYSKPNTQYTLHFYKSNQKSPSHFGEGQFYLDSISVTTNDSGWAFLNTTLNKVISDDQFITALAVDAEGNTSEFSRALCLKDFDGDGIYDCWESEGDGIDVNADGIIDLNLYSKGAKPHHKDIFVEVDYMQGFGPNDNALTMVQNAFNTVPNEYINNPDNQPGINLIIELNDIPVPGEPLAENPWTRFQEIKKEYFGTLFERADPNAKYILEAKKLVYRYCLWASFFGAEGNSGLAENNDKMVGGDDFLITLGTFEKKNSDSVQAGTFMHELGHTFGLLHGGIDTIHYKPNYISVMNYAWQTPQIKGEQENLNWRLDYSRQELHSLSENLLWEAQGMGASYRDYPDSIYIPYSNIGVADVMLAVMYPNTPIDWDGDGDISGFSSRPLDINDLNDPSKPSPGETLLGHNDWSNLKYNFRNSKYFRGIPGVLSKENMDSFEKEMTQEIYDYLQSLPAYGIVPPVMVQASIKWLGTLGGSEGESIAWGISDNGRVVVGTATDSASDYQDLAFRWTPETGMQSLGNLGNNPNWSEATGISADGNIIVGYAYDDNNIQRAFRWTEATGMQDLGAGDNSEATSVSSDGTYITVNVNQNAFRWSEAGMINLGTLGGTSSYATAISSNGSVVVGSSDIGSNPYAYRWTEGSGMQNIGTYYSFARGISGDGNTVTGFETGSAGLYRAFRWSFYDGMQMNIVGNFSQGSDVTFDGSYVVGDGSNGAFRKSSSGQIDWYNEILADSLTPGSDLYSLTAISSDGRFAVGYGFNAATNRDEAFILDTGGRLITSVGNNDFEKTIDTYYLAQNYPNPFNPVTTIRYNIPNASQVSISIFNILGQKVTTLVDDFKYAGSYEVKFDASRLASGIYLYNIQAGKYFETKKMILLK